MSDWGELGGNWGFSMWHYSNKNSPIPILFSQIPKIIHLD